MPALTRAVQWVGGGSCVELLLLRGADPAATHGAFGWGPRL
jgi:hypothetical protein